MINFLDILPIPEAGEGEHVVYSNGHYVVVKEKELPTDDEVIEVDEASPSFESAPASSEMVAAGALTVVVLLVATLFLMRQSKSNVISA